MQPTGKLGPLRPAGVSNRSQAHGGGAGGFTSTFPIELARNVMRRSMAALESQPASDCTLPRQKMHDDHVSDGNEFEPLDSIPLRTTVVL